MSVGIISMAITVTVFNYYSALENSFYPFEEIRYRENSELSVKYDRACLKSRARMYLHDTKIFHTGFDVNEFCWFMNDNGDMDIYIFKDPGYKKLKTIKFNKDLNITKYEYADRFEIVVTHESHRIYHASYMKQIKKIIEWKKEN